MVSHVQLSCRVLLRCGQLMCGQLRCVQLRRVQLRRVLLRRVQLRRGQLSKHYVFFIHLAYLQVIYFVESISFFKFLLFGGDMSKRGKIRRMKRKLERLKASIEQFASGLAVDRDRYAQFSADAHAVYNRTLEPLDISSIKKIKIRKATHAFELYDHVRCCGRRNQYELGVVVDISQSRKLKVQLRTGEIKYFQSAKNFTKIDKTSPDYARSVYHPVQTEGSSVIPSRRCVKSTFSVTFAGISSASKSNLSTCTYNMSKPISFSERSSSVIHIAIPSPCFVIPSAAPSPCSVIPSAAPPPPSLIPSAAPPPPSLIPSAAPPPPSLIPSAAPLISRINRVCSHTSRRCQLILHVAPMGQFMISKLLLILKVVNVHLWSCTGGLILSRLSCCNRGVLSIDQLTR